MTTDYKDVLKRTGTEAQLRGTDQLEEGQLAIANDVQKILHKRRASASEKPSQIIEFAQSCDAIVFSYEDFKKAMEDNTIFNIYLRRRLVIDTKTIQPSGAYKNIYGERTEFKSLTFSSIPATEISFFNSVKFSGGASSFTASGEAKIFFRSVSGASTTVNFTEPTGTGFLVFEKNTGVNFAGDVAKINRALWDNTAEDQLVTQAYSGDYLVGGYTIALQTWVGDMLNKISPPFPSDIWPSLTDVPIGTVVRNGGKNYQVGKKICEFINQDAIPHYYCDSVSGSDSNDGLTDSTPKQTVSAVVALASGPCVFEFARGSYFREQLTVPFNDSVVKTDGTGDRPVFDCADVVDWVWKKTTGYTNVWEKTGVPTELILSGKVAGVVWFNGNRMIKAISTAICDTTPASYKIDINGSGVATIRIHSPDSIDPNTDGYLYEYAKRNYGVEQFGYGDQSGNGEIYSIYTKRNGGNNGSLLGSKYIEDCYAYDGTLHNMWNGGIAKDCTTYRGKEGTSFVSYDGSGYGKSFRYENCKALNDETPTFGWRNDYTGFYVHSGNGFNIDNVTYENCLVENFYDGFGSADVKTIVFKEPTVNECSHAFRLDALDVRIFKPKIYKCGKVLQYKDFYNNSYEFKGGEIYGYGTTAFGGLLRVRSTNFDVVGNTFYLIDKISAMEVIKNTITDNLLFKQNIIANPTGCSFIESDYDLSSVLDSDLNLVQNNSIKVVDNLTTYTTFSAYQTALTKDTNSLIGDPLFTGDPSLGDYSISPLSPANSIGAGSTNYVVTVQDLQYMNVLNEI